MAAKIACPHCSDKPFSNNKELMRHLGFRNSQATVNTNGSVKARKRCHDADTCQDPKCQQLRARFIKSKSGASANPPAATEPRPEALEQLANTALCMPCPAEAAQQVLPPPRCLAAVVVISPTALLD